MALSDVAAGAARGCFLDLVPEKTQAEEISLELMWGFPKLEGPQYLEGSTVYQGKSQSKMDDN